MKYGEGALAEENCARCQKSFSKRQALPGFLKLGAKGALVSNSNPKIVWVYHTKMLGFSSFRICYLHIWTCL